MAGGAYRRVTSAGAHHGVSPGPPAPPPPPPAPTLPILPKISWKRPVSRPSVGVLSRSMLISATCSRPRRSEEHTSELQSLMRISYAVFCLKQKTDHETTQHHTTHLVHVCR